MNVINLKDNQRRMKGIMQRTLGLYTDAQLHVATEVVKIDNQLATIRSQINGHTRPDYNNLVSEYQRVIYGLWELIRTLPTYDRSLAREIKDTTAAIELSVSNMQFIVYDEPKRLNTINIIILCDKLVSLELKAHNVPF